MHPFSNLMPYPPNKYAWYNKGIDLDAMGRYEDAINCYDKAIEIDPLYALTWYNKGLALQALHRYAEADAAFDRAKKLWLTG